MTLYPREIQQDLVLVQRHILYREQMTEETISSEM